MHIIIGLGNPDGKYQATRHNIGWDAVTRISDDYHIPLKTARHKAICGMGFIEGEKVILAQPLTYMNLSGESVRELVDYYKVSPEDIIVIYDDTSLDVGQLRIRKKGSAGGHNGIKSIISQLGTDVFPRIKVGIGERPKSWKLADYVLSRFMDEEQPIIRQALKDSSYACRTMLKSGIDEAMNIYNRKKAADNENSKQDKGKKHSKQTDSKKQDIDSEKQNTDSEKQETDNESSDT